MRRHHVRVGPLPRWLDAGRLLGPPSPQASEGEGWTFVETEHGREASAELEGPAAADLAARLRKLVIDARPIVCAIEPPLPRSLVRAARSEDARRRRSTSPGFTRAGVRLDDEGRWSLTPEALALQIGRWARGRKVIDAGCGVGGNAIGFARAGSSVVAIEQDPERLAMARHNARIYGVADRIRFVQGDAVTLVDEHVDREALIFADPPWGRDWAERALSLQDFPLLAALVAMRARAFGLWVKLPASFPVGELCSSAPAEVEAMFGVGEGDRRWIKFVLVQL